MNKIIKQLKTNKKFLLFLRLLLLYLQSWLDLKLSEENKTKGGSS